MSSTIKIFNSVLFLILLFGMTISNVYGQAVSEKEFKKHQERVAESKEKGKVIVSLDTIFNSGTPYAILKEKKVALQTEYTLSSLSGKELLYIQTENIDDPKSASGKTYYKAFIFAGSGSRGEIVMGGKVEKVIVEYDLVKDSVINPDGEKKFLLKNPPKYSNKPQQVIVVNTSQYNTVTRNRAMPIFVNGSEIKQDNKVIGTFTKTTDMNYGKSTTIIAVFLPDGTKVAEATAEGYNPKSFSTVTLKDNRSHSVNTTTYGNEVKDIAKYLTDLQYL
ncbi:MAG: hypothetical protein ACOZCO_07210 [Bacteroidota bacterium]